MQATTLVRSKYLAGNKHGQVLSRGGVANSGLFLEQSYDSDLSLVREVRRMYFRAKLGEHFDA
jgi:hypothetical protein